MERRARTLDDRHFYTKEYAPVRPGSHASEVFAPLLRIEKASIERLKFFMVQQSWPGYTIFDPSLESEGLEVVAPTIERIRRRALDEWGTKQGRFEVSLCSLDGAITDQTRFVDIAWLWNGKLTDDEEAKLELWTATHDLKRERRALFRLVEKIRVMTTGLQDEECAEIFERKATFKSQISGGLDFSNRSKCKKMLETWLLEYAEKKKVFEMHEQQRVATLVADI